MNSQLHLWLLHVGTSQKLVHTAGDGQVSTVCCVVGIFHGGVIFTFFIVEWDPGEINLSLFLTRIRVRVVLQTPVFMRHFTATIPIL